MQSLEVSGALRPIYVSLGVKRLSQTVCLSNEAIHSTLHVVLVMDACIMQRPLDFTRVWFRFQIWHSVLIHPQNNFADWKKLCLHLVILKHVATQNKHYNIAFKYCMFLNYESEGFDICVTVHHWYNNINSQLDETIILLLIISISSTCFGR